MDWLTHPAIKFSLPALKVVTCNTDLALFSVITQMSSESSFECLESLARTAGDSLRNLSLDG